MTRFVFRAAGDRRPRQFRHGGLIVPPGMLAVSKASRRERALNREARERAAAALERDLADVIASFRAGLRIGEIEAGVVAGDARVVVHAAIPNELEAQFVAVLGHNLEQALEAGARIGFRFAPPALQGVPVGMATEAAVAYVERQGATAAVGLTQSAREGIREMLTLGLRDRLSPVEVARRIGNIAGLTPREVRAVENYRRALTRRLAPIEEALTPQVEAVIEQQVARFQDRQLLYRGRTIAETETQAAITQGERAFWDRAVAEGAVDAEEVVKTWRTVLDAQVCPICEPLHSQSVAYREVFFSAVGGLDGPPAHPRCRCYIEYALTGEPSRRPDRGQAALEQQENVRFLDPTALQEDLQRAQSQRLRTSQRLSRLRSGSRSALGLERSLAVSTATVQSIERQIERLAG